VYKRNGINDEIYSSVRLLNTTYPYTANTQSVISRKGNFITVLTNLTGMTIRVFVFFSVSHVVVCPSILSNLHYNLLANHSNVGELFLESPTKFMFFFL